MSEVKIKRLSKVAREFNVGINTLVDFLALNGVEIDANPNTKIEDDVYQLLVKEFQGERSVKKASEEVELNKGPRETISIEEEAPIVVKEEKREEISAKESARNSHEERDLKVIGKIDLDALNQRTRPAKKTEVKVEKKEEPKEEKVEVRKDVPKPPPEHIRVNVQKLDGPKVLGKIDLPDKKPVATSTADRDAKKKRKRIQKPLGEVKVKSEGGGYKGKKDFGNKKKRTDKPELSEKEVQDQIKETLARLTGGGKNKGAKFRREKRDAAKEQMQKELEEQEAQKSVLKVTEFVTANELANLMGVAVNDVIGACMSLGMFVSINQRLDAETLNIVAEEFGFTIQFTSAEEEEVLEVEDDKEEDLVDRSPVVTVMGHVDHGKTSLLDYIRKENVIAGEAGGITQHIGAYNVELPNGKHITFLDTPGHEAFTAMRARGAQVTDVVIVVIAADDKVMPQTIEAINHAQAAGVPMVFAINKIDVAGANPDKIKEALSAMNILVEDWGGKFQCQEISAKKGTNVEALLEKVLLEAELQGLKANPNKNAVGTVLESSLDKGRGYVTNILVAAGTLHIGDVILAGPYASKVRAMFNERGQNVKEVGPSVPVSILGLSGAPSAGDKFVVMDDEKEAKYLANKRLQLQREQGVRTKRHITLDEIGRRIAIGDFQELNVIVKGDVDGSIEALTDSLLKLSTQKIQVNVIHKSVGQITESDVMLAAASDAIIVGFQVRPSASARKLAEKEEIDIRLYSIIYSAIGEIKDAMEGMLATKIEEKIVGTIEIRETFKISKIGTIAGCMVLEGKVSRNNKIRLIRDGIVIYDGALGSLKRFKDDVKEVARGYECGLNIDNYNDIKVGDVVEAYEEVEVKQTL